MKVNDNEKKLSVLEMANVMCICAGRKSNAEKMGKKGSWFSTIKRVFVHESKDKPSPYVRHHTRETSIDLLLVFSLSFRVDIKTSFHILFVLPSQYRCI